MNRPDGTVEAVFEGPKETIQELITWCSKHQQYARVTDTDITWEEYQNEFEKFKIKY